MAFDFDMAGDILGIGAGLYDIFRDHDNPYADAMAANLAAATDPNSPQFKNLAALFEERNRAAAVKNIQQIMTQNQRARARGDRGFIVNPERRDEFRTSSLNKAFMDAGQAARDEARNTLMGTAGQYGQLIPYGAEQDQRTSGYINAGAGLASDLMGLFSNNNPQTHIPLYDPDQINDYGY